MKILVTGSEGYLGVPLVQALVREGYEVIGLDTGFYREGWLYNRIKKPSIVIDKDVRLVKTEDLVGFDVVIHLAELSNDPLGETDPEVTHDINHQGTVNLADSAKKAGVRQFIYFSSASVYGASDKIRDERSPLNPLTTYAKCKVLNEKYLLKIASKSFSPIILRNATAFGPSPRFRFDLVVNNLVGNAYLYGEIKMESDGTSWRPFIHTNDIARVVLAILKSPKSRTHKQIFNVGSTKNNYQIKDIAKAIKSALPKSKISLNPNGADKRNYKVSFKKLENFYPEIKNPKTLKQGIKELVSLFNDINLTKDLFESKDVTRIKKIKFLKSSGKIDKNYYWTKK